VIFRETLGVALTILIFMSMTGRTTYGGAYGEFSLKRQLDVNNIFQLNHDFSW
jgi:hypothetical protein